MRIVFDGVLKFTLKLQ